MLKSTFVAILHMTEEQNNDTKKPDTSPKKKIDEELWKEIQELTKTDNGKLKAVQIIFEKHNQLPTDYFPLIRKLAQKDQPKEIRIQIAENLLQFDNIPFGMHNDLVSILSKDPEEEVKKIVIKVRIKKASTFSKSLNDLTFGLSPALKAATAFTTAANRFSYNSGFAKMAKAIQNPYGIRGLSDMFNPLHAGYEPPQPRYDIDREKDLLNILKKENAIVLLELFPLNGIDRLNEFSQSKYGTTILNVEKRLSRGTFQLATNSIELTDSFSNNIQRTILHSFYFVGDYIQLIFVCYLDLTDFKKSLTNTEEDSKKLREKLEEIQKEIERNMHANFHGFFHKNQLNAFQSPTSLPSIFIYDVREYLHFLKERVGGRYGTIDIFENTRTTRQRAEHFVDEFADSLMSETNNYLERLGFYSNKLLGVIDESLIISRDKKFFEHKRGKLPCRFVALCFNDFVLFGKKGSELTHFLLNFSFFYYVLAITEQLKISLEDIMIPIESSSNDEPSLNLEKHNLSKLNNQVTIIEEKHRLYKDGRKDAFEHGLKIFHNDEFDKRQFIGERYEVDSISHYFNDKIDINMEDIEEAVNYKRSRINEQLEKLNSELQLIKDKPTINSFLIDVEYELISQIKKRSGKISQKEIEEWLLNFDNSEDRKVALKLLDKLSFVTYEDLKTLSKTLLNKITSQLNLNIENCAFAPIGGITSGSTHILKIFQEENSLKEKLFSDLEKLSNPTQKKPLILLDDFIGSGNTFCKWFENDKMAKKIRTMNYDIYYCVLTAFEKGIKKIEEKTKIKTIFGYLYEQEAHQVREGKLFNEKDKAEVEKLMKKYESRLPHDYIWGYDDSQLLVAFQGNIPNNSISILWSDKGWTPLIRRK